MEGGRLASVRVIISGGSQTPTVGSKRHFVVGCTLYMLIQSYC